MMTNATVAQKGGFASVIGTSKPAAAMEGMGMDFLALLESVEALPADGDGEAGLAAAASAIEGGERIAPAVLEESCVRQDAALPSKSTTDAATPVPATGPAAAAESTDELAPVLLPVEKAAFRPDAAKFTGTASALPHLAVAMAHEGDVSPPENVKADAADKDKTVGGGETAVEAPIATAGLALSLLQNVEQLAPAVPPPAGKNAAIDGLPRDPQAAALKAFALPRSTPRQAATLPAQATNAAQLEVSDPLPAAPDVGIVAETAQAPGKEMASSAIHQKNEKQPVDARISAPVVSAPSQERAAAPANRREAAAQPVDTAATSPVPAVPVAAPPAPIGQPPLVEASAAPMMATPVADTAALLGEQVIDMGVDGQWIDRMAREIADISAGTGRASFTLNPDNLGRLQVEILQREEGADVRLIAETDEAVNALNQGRHQLQQDSRLQSARIGDVQIEHASANGDPAPAPRSASGQELAQQQGQSQSQAFHKKPMIESVSRRARGEEPGDEAESAASSRNARYA